MTTQRFRWTIICLLVGVILAIGVVGFLIWNQQGDHEPLIAGESSGQPGKRIPTESPGESVSGAEESEEKPKPKRAEASSGKEESQKKPKPERVEDAKTYQVDTKASRIYVKLGSATRIGHPHGVEGNLKSGTITLGAGGELVFDMSSFKADTKEAREKVGLGGKKISENEAKKVNEAMLSADVLDVEKFPTASYRIISITPAERQEAGAPGTYQVNGRLTLHGAEQPVQFKAKLEQTDKQGTAKLSGSFAIKQTDYGITPYSAAGGLVKVADRLDISGELLLNPAQ